MAQVKLTNILTVGDFENSGWHGGAYDSFVKKYGNYSMRLDGTTGVAETLTNTINTFPLVQTHIYYARYELYHNGAPGTCGMYWPIVKPNFKEGISLGPSGSWNIISAINNCSSFVSSNYQFRVDYNNAYVNGTVWIDGAMLIDLTACFGVGNEPDQAFCDEIPFFIGEMNYPSINMKVKVNDVWKDIDKILIKRGRHGLQ